MYFLKATDCTNKKVLVRFDGNISLEHASEPSENFRLQLLKESVDAILRFPGASVTLLTHFGRPEGKVDPQFSTRGLTAPLTAVLKRPVRFLGDALQKPVFQAGSVTLLENVRFYKEEEVNDPVFAKKLAAGFDLYVNEAFSVCHRAHASVAAITKFLPSVAGVHLAKEVKDLTEALEHPGRPALAILGGAKIETKLPLIHVFEKKYDTVLLGGRIANEAVDQNITLKENVLLPVDYRNENDSESGSSSRLDIGDATVRLFTEHIQNAGTIVWNGPLGKFEEAPYDTGTMAIAKALADSDAHVIAGGGESLLALQQAGVFDAIDVVSSGGGAMLAFLAGEPMPGLSALK